MPSRRAGDDGQYGGSERTRQPAENEHLQIRKRGPISPGVIAIGQLNESRVLMPERRTRGDQQAVFLASAFPFVRRLPADGQNIRNILAHPRERREFIDLGQKLRLLIAGEFPHVEMLCRLPANRNEAGD